MRVDKGLESVWRGFLRIDEGLKRVGSGVCEGRCGVEPVRLVAASVGIRTGVTVNRQHQATKSQQQPKLAVGDKCICIGRDLRDVYKARARYLCGEMSQLMDVQCHV